MQKLMVWACILFPCSWLMAAEQCPLVDGVYCGFVLEAQAKNRQVGEIDQEPEPEPEPPRQMAEALYFRALNDPFYQYVPIGKIPECGSAHYYFEVSGIPTVKHESNGADNPDDRSRTILKNGSWKLALSIDGFYVGQRKVYQANRQFRFFTMEGVHNRVSFRLKQIDGESPNCHRMINWEFLPMF